MTIRWTLARTAIALALAGSACAVPNFAAAQAASPTAPVTPKADKPAARTVLPGDDFFAYANGDWLAKTDISSKLMSFFPINTWARAIRRSFLARISASSNSSGRMATRSWSMTG